MSNSQLIPSPDALSAFYALFGHAPSLCAAAPGRINLIGEHTDYNEGYVFPVAIDRYTTAYFSRRDDERFICHSAATNETVDSGLDELSGFRKKGWFSYVAGVASLLAEEGIDVGGTNCLLSSSIPIGSGLSSSAALEVSVALGLTALAERSLSTERTILLCQKAEWDWVGVSCGIMDQFISVRGVSDTALLIDCRSLDHLTIPVDPSITLTICDTNVPHTLAVSEYNKRLEECRRAVDVIRQEHPSIASLRDVSMDVLRDHRKKLDDTSYDRAHHVISENERVLEASDALWYKDHQSLGTLLNHSHESLRKKYAVSCTELDVMAGICRSVDGVFGARMVGAGFGGSVLALSHPETSSAIRDTVMSAYKAQTGIEATVLSCRTAAGARVIRLR